MHPDRSYRAAKTGGEGPVVWGMTAILALFALMLGAGAGFAATPKDVLLRCIQAAGIKTEFTIQSGRAGRKNYAYVDTGPGMSAPQAAAINACADRSGGHTGRGSAQAQSAPVRPKASHDRPPALPQMGQVARQQSNFGCVPGFGVMQRGNLYCIGY